MIQYTTRRIGRKFQKQIVKHDGINNVVTVFEPKTFQRNNKNRIMLFRLEFSSLNCSCVDHWAGLGVKLLIFYVQTNATTTRTRTAAAEIQPDQYSDAHKICMYIAWMCCARTRVPIHYLVLEPLSMCVFVCLCVCVSTSCFPIRLSVGPHL